MGEYESREDDMISLPKISGPFAVGDIVRIDRPGSHVHNQTGIVTVTTETSSFCEVQTGPERSHSVHKDNLYFETNPGASITLLLGMEQTLLGEVVSWERAEVEENRHAVETWEAHMYEENEEGDPNDTL